MNKLTIEEAYENMLADNTLGLMPSELMQLLLSTKDNRVDIMKNIMLSKKMRDEQYDTK